LLVVEDNPLVFRALRRALAPRFEATFVTSGRAALAEILEHDFDAVLSDVCMAGVDGRRVLAAVREVQPTTFRILLTATPEARGLEVADYVIAKPCSLKELVATIEHFGGTAVR
jgi:CheY-like chemotaxis protein